MSAGAPRGDVTVADLLRILTKVATGDFSEKPPVLDRDDDLARLAAALGFLLEDLERAQHEREQEVRRLTELAEAKAQFSNTAAHELHTPLTPIVTQVHILKAQRIGPLNDKQRQAVEVLERNVVRLSKLVNELLEAARLDSPTAERRREPVDLRQVVAEALQAFGAQAAEDGILLEADAPEPLPVRGDPQRLAQVLTSLVSNALKFTPSGGRVLVEARRDGPSAVVQVRDSGVGLTADQAARLFQAFVQVHNVNDGRRPGSGMGLFIAKGVVEQHGGRIWCDSAGEGRGATFSFSLPLDAAAAAKVAQRP